jgi:Tol biopolymer transport system component
MLRIAVVALLLALSLLLPSTSAAAKPSPDVDPAWSADGKDIAFARLPSEGPVDTRASIRIVGRDGRGARQITPGSDPSFFSRPAWSPDGVWLSFQVSAR